MANDGEFNTANTLSSISQDVAGKKVDEKKRNAANMSNEVMYEVVSSAYLQGTIYHEGEQGWSKGPARGHLAR